MTIKRWLCFNIGCIECGVSSAVVGTFETEQEATAAANLCQHELDWREGGQNAFSVFDLLAPMAQEYKEVLEKKDDTL